MLQALRPKTERRETQTCKDYASFTRMSFKRDTIAFPLLTIDFRCSSRDDALALELKKAKVAFTKGCCIKDVLEDCRPLTDPDSKRTTRCLRTDRISDSMDATAVERQYAIANAATNRIASLIAVVAMIAVRV